VYFTYSLLGFFPRRFQKKINKIGFSNQLVIVYTILICLQIICYALPSDLLKLYFFVFCSWRMFNFADCGNAGRRRPLTVTSPAVPLVSVGFNSPRLIHSDAFGLSPSPAVSVFVGCFASRLPPPSRMVSLRACHRHWPRSKHKYTAPIETFYFSSVVSRRTAIIRPCNSCTRRANQRERMNSPRQYIWQSIVLKKRLEFWSWHSTKKTIVTTVCFGYTALSTISFQR